MADDRLGSAGRFVRAVAGCFCGRGGGRRVAARSVAPARDGERRIRHRVPHGELHGTRCRAPRDAPQGGLADSWATDAHKWLNVPYDSGLVFVANSAAHRAAMSLTAAYLVRAPQEPREPMDWTPEASRRARGFAVYAALRSLGRQGVADLVDRCCRLARRFADRLGTEPAIQILNDVVLNQVLVRVVPQNGDADAATREALRLVQEERVCWLGATRWHGMDAIRISVSNWSTTEDDVDRSTRSIIHAVERVTGQG